MARPTALKLLPVWPQAASQSWPAASTTTPSASKNLFGTWKIARISAVGAPGEVAAARLAPDELAGLAFHALRWAFLVDQRAFEHVGLLDSDVLMVG